MGWSIIGDAVKAICVIAVLPCVVAWASAIGWHIGRRDAAKWFGPTRSDHDIRLINPKDKD